MLFYLCDLGPQLLDKSFGLQNDHRSVLESQSDTLKSLVLSDKQSKTQRYSMWYHMRKRKAANALIGRAGMRELAIFLEKLIIKINYLLISQFIFQSFQL